MKPLKQWGQIAAISRYCLIVSLWMAFITSLHQIDLFYKLRYLFGTCETKWFYQCCQAWGLPRSGVFDAFLVFLLKICFSYGLTALRWFKIGYDWLNFISSLIFLYLVLSRYFSLQHNWWTSSWHRISCKY